ncbi:hypothetical protein FACS189499_10710 [Clostridia bacterium]|nr:hypothetical protein FACS189499_10710 [Clostridia bacterium]
MNYKDILKSMVGLFGFITTGALLSMCLFLAIFEPNAELGLRDIIGIPFIGIAADLPLLVFISRKELSTRAMLVRKIIHCAVTCGVVLCTALFMEWVSIHETAKICFFVAVFAVVYTAYILADWFRQKRDSDKINLALKERNSPRE